MPTYEYVCTSCQKPLEVVQSIHEPSLTACPACADGRLRKVFGNVGVVFKGSGFYRTDSRSKPTAAATATPRTDSKDSNGSKGSNGSKNASEAGGGSGSPGDKSGAKSDGGQGSKGSTGSTTSSQKTAAAAPS